MHHNTIAFPRFLLATLAILAAGGRQARGGGCSQWRAGPMQPTSTINGLPSALKEACAWDPDGAGPQPAVVAMATYGYEDPWYPQYSIPARIITFNPLTNTLQQIGQTNYGGQVNDCPVNVADLLTVITNWGPCP